MPLSQSDQDPFITNIIAGLDHRQRQSKWQPPRQELLPFPDRLHRKPVPLQNRMTQRQRRALERDLRPLLQRAARNRDIILRRRQPPDTFKCNWANCRHSSPLSHRPHRLAAQYHFPEGRLRRGRAPSSPVAAEVTRRTSSCNHRRKEVALLTRLSANSTSRPPRTRLTIHNPRAAIGRPILLRFPSFFVPLVSFCESLASCRNLHQHQIIILQQRHQRFPGRHILPPDRDCYLIEWRRG